MAWISKKRRQFFAIPLLLVQPDVEHSEEEERWLALGKSVSQLLLVVVHTEDETTIRLISARRAEPKERRRYEHQAEGDN
jgi:uncharacterized DUF497 family protein